MPPVVAALGRLDRRRVLPALPADVEAALLRGIGQVLGHLGAAGQLDVLDARFGEVAVVVVEPGLLLVDHLVQGSARHIGRADVAAALGALLQVAAAAHRTVQQLVRQVHAPGALQRLDHQLAVVGLLRMDQRLLHAPLAVAAADLDGLHGEGVQAADVHRGADGHRDGDELLHLVRVHVLLAQGGGGIDHGVERRSRMAGDEVLRHELPAARLLRGVLEPALELLEGVEGRLVHQRQHALVGGFRRHLHDAADVVAGDLVDVAVAVPQGQVVADAALDEDVFDAADAADAAQGGDVLVDAALQARAGRRPQAVAVEPGAELAHLAALHAEHVGARAPDIADGAVEAGQRGDALRLLHHRVDAAVLDLLALVVDDGTEVAVRDAAAVGDDGALHRLQRRHAFGIGGVFAPGVGQGVDAVEGGLVEGRRRRVLHHEARAGGLHHDAAALGVLLQEVDALAVGELRGIGGDLLEGGGLHHAARPRVGDGLAAVGHPAGAADVVEVLDRLARAQAVGDLQDLLLGHARGGG